MEWKYGPAAQSINQTLSFLFIQSSIKLNFFNLNWIDWWRKEELIVDELLAAPQFVSRIELPRSFLSFNQPFHFFSLHSKKFHYWFHSSFTHKLILQSTNHSINSNQLIHQSNWILIEWIELMDWWMNVDWLVAHESKKVCLFSFIGGAPAAGSGHNPPIQEKQTFFSSITTPLLYWLRFARHMPQRGPLPVNKWNSISPSILKEWAAMNFFLLNGLAR